MNKKVREAEEAFGRLNPESHLLPMMMDMAVTIRAFGMVKRGGPANEEWTRAMDTGQLLAEKGDVLLFGGDGCAEVFNRTAEAVAVLSFLPGGITLFGRHYENKAVEDGEEGKPEAG